MELILYFLNKSYIYIYKYILNVYSLYKIYIKNKSIERVVKEISYII